MTRKIIIDAKIDLIKELKNIQNDLDKDLSYIAESKLKQLISILEND